MSRSANGSISVLQGASEEFDRLKSEARFVMALQEGLDDHAAGRVVSNDELGRRLDARFGALTEKT